MKNASTQRSYDFSKIFFLLFPQAHWQSEQPANGIEQWYAEWKGYIKW